jgi:serine/threonine protein kinase
VPKGVKLQNTDPKRFGAWKTKARIDSRKDKLIFLAEQDGVLAAIKVLKNADLMSMDDWNKFALEIKNLKQLSHPNIPKYLDSDLSNSSLPWVASEYIQGSTLQELVELEGKLEPDVWIKALTDTLEALSYVHEVGLIHRDISPSNIIISESRTCLIDFGIAKQVESLYSTVSIGQAGTPATESPEHLKNFPDPKMDIFSLGATFAYSGTGHFPFSTEPPSVWINSVLHDRPNLAGLSDLQLMVVKPMLFKNLADRVSAADALKLIQVLQSKTEDNDNYVVLRRKYIERSDDKLVDNQPAPTTHQARQFDFKEFFSGRALWFTVLGLLAAVFLMVWFGTSSGLREQAQQISESPVIGNLPPSEVSPGASNSDASETESVTTPIGKKSSLKAARTPSADSQSGDVDASTPLLSSEKLDLSAPLATNVEYDYLFGMPWRTGGLYWGIPLQSTSTSEVPDLTGIQVRPTGFPNGPWLEIPYKLKISRGVDTVYAQVDELLLTMLFEREICPEFRVVKEVKAEIVKVWTKGDSECADDYNP